MRTNRDETLTRIVFITSLFSAEWRFADATEPSAMNYVPKGDSRNSPGSSPSTVRFHLNGTTSAAPTAPSRPLISFFAYEVAINHSASPQPLVNVNDHSRGSSPLSEGRNAEVPLVTRRGPSRTNDHLPPRTNSRSRGGSKSRQKPPGKTTRTATEATPDLTATEVEVPISPSSSGSVHVTNTLPPVPDLKEQRSELVLSDQKGPGQALVSGNRASDSSSTETNTPASPIRVGAEYKSVGNHPNHRKGLTPPPVGQRVGNSASPDHDNPPNIYATQRFSPLHGHGSLSFLRHGMALLARDRQSHRPRTLLARPTGQAKHHLPTTPLPQMWLQGSPDLLAGHLPRWHHDAIGYREPGQRDPLCRYLKSLNYRWHHLDQFSLSSRYGPLSPRSVFRIGPIQSLYGGFPNQSGMSDLIGLGEHVEIEPHIIPSVAIWDPPLANDYSQFSSRGAPYSKF